MKMKTLTHTARDCKNELRDQVRGRDEGAGDTALLAWEILGGLVVLLTVVGIASMLPELVRYMRIKRM